MQVDIRTILADPDFRASKPETKREILSLHDEDFAKSSRSTQDEILRGLSAEYRTPPTIGDYIGGGIRQAAREALPLAGLILGGAAGGVAGGAATGPLAPLGAAGGAVLGAGLGYGMGEQANRLITAAMPSLPGQFVAQPPLGLPAPAPTFGGQIADIGKDIALGAAIQMAPATLGAVGRGARGLMGTTGATGADIAVRQAASRQGVPLTAAAASASAPGALLEAIPARFPIGRQTVEPMVKETQRASLAAAKELGVSIGPTTTLEEAGLTIRAELRKVIQQPTVLVDDAIQGMGGVGLTKRELGQQIKTAGTKIQETRRAAASRAYDEALAGQGSVDVPLARTQEVSTAIVSFEQRLQGVPGKVLPRAAGLQKTSGAPPVSPANLPPEALTELLRSPASAEQMLAGMPLRVSSLSADFIERYGLSTSGSRTLEETMAIQQRLRGLVRSAPDDVTRRQVTNLLDAVTDDISRAFPGTALADAARFYKTEVATYFARRAPLRKLLGKEPSRVADEILAARSPERLDEIMKIFPEREKDNVRRAVLDRLKQRSIDTRTGHVNPDVFAREVAALGDDMVGTIFGPRSDTVRGLRQTLTEQFGRGTTFKDIVTTIETRPEQIVNMLMRGKIKSMERFDAIWNHLTPAARQESRSALYTEALDNAFDPITGRFSIERYLRQVEMVPKEVWTRVLMDNQRASLNDLALVFRRISEFTRIAANPSQTSAAILGPAQVLGTGERYAGLGMNLMVAGAGGGMGAALSSGDPYLTAASITMALMSPTILGKAVYSKSIQRLLTSPAPQLGGATPLTWLESMSRAAPSKRGLLYRAGAVHAVSPKDE